MNRRQFLVVIGATACGGRTTRDVEEPESATTSPSDGNVGGIQDPTVIALSDTRVVLHAHDDSLLAGNAASGAPIATS